MDDIFSRNMKQMYCLLCDLYVKAIYLCSFFKGKVLILK